jgi:hypothetical protein
MEPHDDLNSPPPPPRQRGRRSAASLSIVPDVKLRRPEPPAALSPDEKGLWREVVEAVRPDWFTGGSDLILECYVRLISQARDLAAGLAKEEVGSERYVELCSLHRSVCMSAGALATKLRLTPRSQFDRNQPKLVSVGPSPRPWEDDAQPEPEPPVVA